MVKHKLIAPLNNIPSKQKFLSLAEAQFNHLKENALQIPSRKDIVLPEDQQAQPPSARPTKSYFNKKPKTSQVTIDPFEEYTPEV